jgi:stearoyl-CoA desaturase (delta-9 desaturase)
MAQFAREVMQRVHRDELRNVDPSDKTRLTLLKRAHRLMVREPRLLDEAARTRLQSALEQSQKLQTVYTMKQKLADIWQRSATTQENLIQALQDWCHEAEATGIHALREFSNKVRTYSLVQTTA